MIEAVISMFDSLFYAAPVVRERSRNRTASGGESSSKPVSDVRVNVRRWVYTEESGEHPRPLFAATQDDQHRKKREADKHTVDGRPNGGRNSTASEKDSPAAGTT